MNARAPSRTAEYMALFRALESARAPDERLFEDPDAARFLRPALRIAAGAARWRAPRAAIVRYIDRRWPGPRLSGVVRTRVIDDFVVAAVHGGCTQLVLLGAGYDTRASRLAALSSTVVFEVDHPATQARKRKAMGTLGGRVRYVPVDFERDPLAPALGDAGFEREQRTCVVWEGVFSYLTPAAIDETLAALVGLCAGGSRILLTYVDRRALDTSDPHPRAWLAAVSDVGEPFRTGLHPSEAAAFFAQRSLTLRDDESTTEAALRLGTVGAQGIPGFYRLATLEVGTRGDVAQARGLRR
jgi:methyltransferase (TIGR00027 family)